MGERKKGRGGIDAVIRVGRGEARWASAAGRKRGRTGCGACCCWGCCGCRCGWNQEEVRWPLAQLQPRGGAGISGRASCMTPVAAVAAVQQQQQQQQHSPLKVTLPGALSFVRGRPKDPFALGLARAEMAVLLALQFVANSSNSTHAARLKCALASRRFFTAAPSAQRSAEWGRSPTTNGKQKRVTPLQSGRAGVMARRVAIGSGLLIRSEAAAAAVRHRGGRRASTFLRSFGPRSRLPATVSSCCAVLP